MSHVAFKCADMDSAVHYYRDILGEFRLMMNQQLEWNIRGRCGLMILMETKLNSCSIRISPIRW